MHNKIDDALASSDLATMQESPNYKGVEPILLGRIDHELGEEKAGSTSQEEKLALAAALSTDEKRVALSLVKRDAFQLSSTLEPLLGKTLANLVFGLGVLGMGFSTIIILMLINGYAFQEMSGRPNGTVPFVVGCLVAGFSGASWWYLWEGESRFWLTIFASNFGMMLLPIAYVTFFLMMNNKRILGDEKPTGQRMLVWNVLMLFAVIGAIVAAVSAIYGKMSDPKAFPAIMGLLIVFGIALVVGFLKKRAEAAA